MQGPPLEILPTQDNVGFNSAKVQEGG